MMIRLIQKVKGGKLNDNVRPRYMLCDGRGGAVPLNSRSMLTAHYRSGTGTMGRLRWPAGVSKWNQPCAKPMAALTLLMEQRDHSGPLYVAIRTLLRTAPRRFRIWNPIL